MSADTTQMRSGSKYNRLIAATKAMSPVEEKLEALSQNMAQEFGQATEQAL